MIARHIIFRNGGKSKAGSDRLFCCTCYFCIIMLLYTNFLLIFILFIMKMKKHQKQILYIIAILTMVGLVMTFSQNSANFKGSLRDVAGGETQEQKDRDEKRDIPKDENQETPTNVDEKDQSSDTRRDETNSSTTDTKSEEKNDTNSTTTSPDSTRDLRNAADERTHLRIDGEVLKGDIAAAGTYELLRFNVTALKDTVVFDQAPSNTYQPSDSLISVVLKGYVEAGNIMTCSLKNLSDSQILDSIDLSTGKGTSLVTNGFVFLDFNFYDKELSIAAGESKKLSVICDLALTAGESVSATLPSMIIPGNDIVDSDDADDNDDDAIEPATVVYQVNGTTVIDPVGALHNLPVIGPTLVGVPY